MTEAGVSVTTAKETFTDCVKTHDTSTLDPDLNEYKYFCKVFGLVAVDESTGRVELVTRSGL